MLRLLIADDEKDARDKTIRCIDKLQNGFTVVGAASDGQEAYQQILSLRPDIVLIDIEMPGMSGLDVIKRIKQAGLPVVFIIISSYQEFAYAQDALRLDVEDYLLKPFLPADICSAVYKAAKHLELLRLLPALKNAPAPPASQNISIAQRMKSPLTYPFEQEKQLLELLRFDGDALRITDALQMFIRAVRTDNSLYAAADCYAILYVELYRLIADFQIELEDVPPPSDSTSEESYVAVLEDYLVELCRQINLRLRGQSASNAFVAAAIKYVKTYYRQELSLGEVAAHVGVSPAYLSTQFHQAIGMRFVDYIHKVRIDAAMQIIAEKPYLKGYEIGELVGYQSAKYFYQKFNDVTGVTYNQYRGQFPSKS